MLTCCHVYLSCPIRLEVDEGQLCGIVLMQKALITVDQRKKDLKHIVAIQ